MILDLGNGVQVCAKGDAPWANWLNNWTPYPGLPFFAVTSTKEPGRFGGVKNNTTDFILKEAEKNWIKPDSEARKSHIIQPFLDWDTENHCWSE